MIQTIEASEKVLGKILNDDFLFEIPDYQRPYAWTTEETSELLDDIMECFSNQDTSSVRELSPYFLGSIVLIKKSNSPSAQVVDGQQRLTTLTILLCVLREMLSKQKEKTKLHKYVCEEGDFFCGNRG